MIQRAGKMVVTETDEGWIVQEPEHDSHMVEKMIKFYTCDCIGYQMRGVCSHIAAVRISLAPKDREDLFGD